MDAASLSAKVLAKRAAPRSFPLLSVSWSPDGRTIAVPGAFEGRLHAEMVFVDAETGTERVVDAPEWRAITHVAWMPDGSGLLVNAQESAGEQTSQIWHMSYPDGARRRVTNDLSTYSGLSLSKDGHTFVSVRNELRARIYVVPDGDAARARPITAGASIDDGVRGVAWTPDGRIIYTSSGAGDTDIWVMNADGTNRVQLTTTRGNDIWPRVTADGKFVAYISEGEGTRGLWRMDIDGGRPRRLAEGSVTYRPVLSADSATVYYSDPRAVDGQQEGQRLDEVRRIAQEDGALTRSASRTSLRLPCAR